MVSTRQLIIYLRVISLKNLCKIIEKNLEKFQKAKLRKKQEYIEQKVNFAFSNFAPKNRFEKNE